MKKPWRISFFFEGMVESYLKGETLSSYFLYFFISNINAKNKSFFAKTEDNFDIVDKLVTNDRKRFLFNNVTLNALLDKSSSVKTIVLYQNLEKDNVINFCSGPHSFTFHPKEYLDIEEFLMHKSFDFIIYKHQEKDGKWHLFLFDGISSIQDIIKNFIDNYDLFYKEKKKKRERVKSARKIL